MPTTTIGTDGLPVVRAQGAPLPAVVLPEAELARSAAPARGQHLVDPPVAPDGEG